MKKKALILTFLCSSLFKLIANPICEEADAWCDQECTVPDQCEENTLFSGLNTDNKRLYRSLDCEGKNRAICLSKEYCNKNLAVQEAAKEMGLRQLRKHHCFKDYQEQKQQRGGQDYYNNRRYGY